MFQDTTEEKPVKAPKQTDAKIMSKYKNFITASGSNTMASNAAAESDKIDQLLEQEKQNMNSEPWNKLDKRLKIQKLHAYAEKYGTQHSLPQKDIKALKTFFSECLTKDKLAKVKDVDYDRNTGVINNVFGLLLNASTRAFTIRNVEKKVSTLKSLTPKKSIVHQEETEDA